MHGTPNVRRYVLQALRFSFSELNSAKVHGRTGQPIHRDGSRATLK